MKSTRLQWVSAARVVVVRPLGEVVVWSQLVSGW
jgi:hypothetical protein